MLNSIFYQVQRWVMAPLTMATQPTDSISRQSLRGRAMLLGIPAVVVAAIGVAALCLATFGMDDTLELRYRNDAERAERQKETLIGELNTELRIKQAANAGNPTEATVDSLIPEDDPRRVKLKQLQNSEQIFWEKLISLNPEEMDYRFNLAMVTINQGDVARGIAFLQAIAPLDEPGYSKAHLFLSRYLMGMKGNSSAEQNQLYELALQHADLCLRRGQVNTTEGKEQRQMAQAIKASLLFTQNKLDDAYQLFDELVDVNPDFYQRLIDINRRLNRPERNREVFQRALSKYETQISESDLSVEKWVAAWTNAVACMAGLGNFAVAEKRLLNEVAKQTATGSEGVVKRVFVEQLLSGLYVAWMRTSEMASAPNFARDLAFLTKAFQYNPKNSDVLRGLTRITIYGEEELAAAAREIYDPIKQLDPPPDVLNELGTAALKEEDYESAVRYFEMARKKNPTSAHVLNNLAYTYLVCEDRNPERSLKLVDEGIRLLNEQSRTPDTESRFYDTRGTALMQLNRLTEAIAAFEKALQGRRWNRGILESLVKCYRGSNLSPEVYEERLRQLDAREAAEKESDQPVSNPPSEK